MHCQAIHPSFCDRAAGEPTNRWMPAAQAVTLGAWACAFNDEIGTRKDVHGHGHIWLSVVVAVAVAVRPCPGVPGGWSPWSLWLRAAPAATAAQERPH